MPSVFKEDANIANWSLVLDELTSLREKLDDLTRGQQQIQESLATNANWTSERSLGTVKERFNSHRAPKTPVGSSIEDSTGTEGWNRVMRRQMTVMQTPPPPVVSLTMGNNCLFNHTPHTPQSVQVNHFATMAEQELQFVFEENAKSKEVKQEISDLIEKKYSNVSRLSATVSNTRPVHKLVEGFYSPSAENLELFFDSIVGLFIFGNAIFLGFSMDADNPDKGAYLVFEIIFGCIFWVEMILKLRMHGWRQRYCCGLKDQEDTTLGVNLPPSRTSCGESFANCFDLTLVVIDTVQLIITIGFPDINLNVSGISASLFRIVRLLRLARILRLLRAKVFSDLLSMIQGMMGGLSALFWSVVLFAIFIYVMALIFREMLGPSHNAGNEVINTDTEWYFRSVSRSMFTIFRCSFGDCSKAGGTPIFEEVFEGSGGPLLSLMYSGFLFMVVIGIFNVISAIFVESTMASAAEMAMEKQRARFQDPKRWAENFMQLLAALLEHVWPKDDDLREALSRGRLTGPLLDRLQKEEISRELFDFVIQTDGNAQRALQELDIPKADHRFLSDILDPDNSSTIGIFELIDGLQRLRGDPRRSDIIAVDLMIRATQLKIDDLWQWTHDALKTTAERAAAPGGARAKTSEGGQANTSGCQEPSEDDDSVMDLLQFI